MKIASETMYFDVISTELVVWVQGSGAPSDEDFGRANRATSRMDPAKVRCLLINDGGVPTKEQRAQAKAHPSMRIPTAIVTDSAAVRFIVAAVSLLNRNLAAFSGANFRDALDWLRCTPAERSLLLATLEKAAATGHFHLVKGTIASLRD